MSGKRVVLRLLSLGSVVSLSLAGVSPAEAICGCETMTVTGSGRFSAIYCAPSPLEIPAGCVATEGGTCHEDETPYHCQLGLISPPPDQGGYLGWGFEVVADLVADSTATDCPEGQFVTTTFRLGGDLQVNNQALDTPAAGLYVFPGADDESLTIQGVADPTFVPQVGATNAAGQPKMGADGYTEADLVKRHEVGQINWVDTPLNGVSQGDTAQDDIRFLSFVQGSTAEQSTCWCLFSIQVTFDGNTAGGTGPTRINGLNCTVTP